MLSGYLIEIPDELPELLISFSIDGNRSSLFELYLHILRLIWSFKGISCDNKGVFWRLNENVFKRTSLYSNTPEVSVVRVWLFLCCNNGNSMFLCVLYLFLS